MLSSTGDICQVLQRGLDSGPLALWPPTGPLPLPGLPGEWERGAGVDEGPLSLRPGLDCTSWFQKLAGERDALQRELDELKKKSEGVRSRNKVLSSEVKTLRSQVGTLVEKGRHDDELIDALMVRPWLGQGNPEEWAPPLPVFPCPSLPRGPPSPALLPGPRTS